jgi:protein involved in polysaccharide export with SLBB domain
VLKDFEKPYFVAGGRVARPGKYDLRGDTTVSQGIALAGGFLDSAKHSQVVLFRRWFSSAVCRMIGLRRSC